MKVRTGFVSNSSTTSFECEICGYSESYDDTISIRDFEVIECDIGHYMCEKHIKDYFPNISESYEDEEYGYLKNEYCPFCQMMEFDNYALKLYLKKEYKITEEEVFAYVKSVNKRRRVLKDEEYVEYVLRKNNLDTVRLEEQIKARFETFDQYWAYINSKEDHR